MKRWRGREEGPRRGVRKSLWNQWNGKTRREREGGWRFELRVLVLNLSFLLFREKLLEYQGKYIKFSKYELSSIQLRNSSIL